MVHVPCFRAPQRLQYLNLQPQHPGHIPWTGACKSNHMLDRLLRLRPRALVFDVDGTLYRHRAVRLGMMTRLVLHSIRHPAQAVPILKVLQAYRRAQDNLRDMDPYWSCIAEEQLQFACRTSGIPRDDAAQIVSEWMENIPLGLILPALYKGLEDVLRTAKQEGLLLAVWSDYPPLPKLQVMGLTSFFDVVVCAQDREVQRFKPHPRGMEVVLQRLGLTRDKVLYIGDRLQVDGEAAARAGVAFILAGDRAYRDLAAALHDKRV